MNTNTTFARRGAVRILVAGVLAVGVARTVAGGDGGTRSTPELLADLARDHGLNRRGKQTPADVLHVRTLLRAAVRLDPRLTETHIWLYDLASRAGDRRQADWILSQLIEADPGHAGIFAQWLESERPHVRSLEDRGEWLQKLLETPRPAPQQALVYAHLARAALERMDRGAAVAARQRALELYALTPEAVVLGMELLAPQADPHVRLGALLEALRVRPGDVELVWRVATLLDECDFAEEAGLFYIHALKVHRGANPAARVPAARLLQMARNATSSGNFEEAILFDRTALQSDEGFLEAGMHLYWLLGTVGRTAEAARLRVELVEQCAEIREPAEWPVDRVAQAAWFYCTIDKQPQRAAMLAEAAARRAPRDLFATRVLGWAQALNLQAAEAKVTLLPIAEADAFAAYQLAKLLMEEGDADAPRRVAEKLTFVRRNGPAHRLLLRLGAQDPTTRPAAERFPRVSAALQRFDRSLLDFYEDPSKFLEATIELENRGPAPGEPWRAVFTLTNRGGFAITLGPDWMVNPQFLLSFEIEGDRQRRYANLMSVGLDRVRVIPPGRSVRMVRTIDVGPLRRDSRRSPQHLQRVTVHALLDPRQIAPGRWARNVGGQRLAAAYFNRVPARTSADGLSALFSAIRGASDAERFKALEVAAELLGESQRHALGRLSYKPEAVPDARLRAVLLSALGAESWNTRVRALDALQVAGLDRQMVDAVEVCLEHPHWLVRLMALRLLARQGERFAERAAALAGGDKDELVRDLARSYVQTWKPAESTAATPDGAP